MTNETNVFVEPTTDTTSNINQDIVSTYIGEGKKFKSVEDVINRKLEADVYVESLRTQLAEKETKLAALSKTDDKFSQILQTIEQNKANNSQGNPQVPALGSNDIADIVRNQMTQIEQERTAEQNTATTNSKLKELFGDKAKEVVESKARELGITMADFKQISAKSPNAFFTMIGATESTPKPSNSNPTGSVNTASDFQTGTKVGSKEYYNELRRKNPREYYSKTIHEVMDKVKKGELVY